MIYSINRDNIITGESLSSPSLSTQNMDVAMIYHGESPHPAHHGFANVVNADLLSLDRYSLPRLSLESSVPEEIANGILLPDYDIYIVEGTRALYGALANQLISDSTLIYLAGDQALYKLLNPSYEHTSTLNSLISEFGMGPLRYMVNKYINGIIAVSNFSLGYTTEVVTGKPSAVANPYIQPDLFEELGQITPDLTNKTAITVGSFDRYKGQDLLVTAWQGVRREHPDAQLKLVGEGYPQSLEETPGVEVLGYVDDLPDALASASLYVQPSRMDNFPVSVLEALRAGLPAIVTETTGNKSVIKQIDEHMITSTTIESIESGIVRYFNQPLSRRKDLSETARVHGSTFDCRSQKDAFQSAFCHVINELGQE